MTVPEAREVVTLQMTPAPSLVSPPTAAADVTLLAGFDVETRLLRTSAKSNLGDRVQVK